MADRSPRDASRTTRWIGGQVQPPPPAARRALWLLALVILAADGLISLARLGAPAPADVAVVDDDSLRRQLERAADDPQPWLLVGDSVLAGDVMAGRVDDWQSQRVIDGMRRHLGPGAPQTLHQVALNGLLPGDVEGIVAELDRVDPAGRVALAIELNPRYFSASHAATDCSRPWLCDLRPAVTGDAIDPLRWAVLLLRELRLNLRRFVPLLRHEAPDLTDPADVLLPRADDAPDDEPMEAAGRARVLRHYTHRITGERSAQWRALERTVRRLRAAGREVVFFAPPLSDGFFAGALPRRHLGALMADLSALIDRPADRRLRFVSLDHPLFADGHFIDHCHLWPAGNRLLALNLLHAIGAPLDHAPPHTAMVDPEGADRTLLANPDRGYADGPAWRALTRSVQGLAVAPGGRRLVVADTGNHALRELVGDLSTLRPLAGRPGRKGYADGPAAQALIERPQSPLIVGDDVWFTTDGGARLRRLAAGVVTTAYAIDGPRWHAIEAIRWHRGSDEHAILILDREVGLLRYVPAERRTTSLLAVSGLQALAAAPDGRVWVADGHGRIFSGRADAPFTLGEPVFANTAPTAVPEREGAYFPFRFDEVRLLDVRDMAYVPRYEGLLVADRHHHRRLDATLHLRLLSLGDQRVYPWMKPRAFGWAELLPNVGKKTWVSPWHRGAMAFDAISGTLFWAERQRSRIYAIRDGILGAAKLSNTPTRKTFFGMQERYGARSGRLAQRTLRPDRFLGDQLGRAPREGPFVVLLIGSSYLAVSDMLGPYSFGRLLEQRLEAELGYRGGVRVELYQRTRAGGKLAQLVDLFEEAVDAGLAPDVLLFGLQDSAGTFLRGLDGPVEVAAAVDRLRQTAARYDTRVIALDSSALIARNNEGLRAPMGMMRRLMKTFEGTGIPVLRIGDMLLADHLTAAPWGAPPYSRNHPSPWAIDAAAARVAHALTPRLLAHFHNRTPGWSRPPVAAQRDERPPLATALAGLPPMADDAPIVAASRLQAERGQGELRLFIDLADAPEGWRRVDEARLRTLALSTTRALIADDPAAGAARRVRVRVARFANYDEYGQGVLQGARIVFDAAWAADALGAALRAEVRGGAR